VPMSLDKLIEGQLAFMQSHYEVIAISSGGITLDAVGAKESVRVIPIEMSRKITPFKDVWALWELYKLFKKERPFIVHSHTPKAGIVGMLAAKAAGVPIRLHTVAGLPLMETRGAKRKVLNIVEKMTYACATMVYPNSFGLRDVILKNNFANKKNLKVLANGSSNGIDINCFSPSQFSNDVNSKLKKDLNISKNDIVFIFVGRLVSDKGINELVKAFKQLVINKNLVKLLLVGSLESDLDPLLPKTLNEIINSKHIISVGYQSDVRPYFAISNVLVFPSYREGFPNVVMQAGSMGLPSIVSDINGCNEIIIHNENGIIVPSKDSISLLNAMQKMFRDDELRFKLRDNSRSMITSRYEQKLVWEALLDEYNNQIANV